MRRKRSSTLIEVIVSLGLISLLLSSLFYCYVLFTKEAMVIRLEKSKISERKYALSRIERILNHGIAFFHSSEEKGLLFIFNRGVFHDPLLSGEVLAHLYHDPREQTLSLGIWPKPDGKEPLKAPSQHFILMDNVQKVDFAFYHPPHIGMTVNPDKIDPFTPQTGWQSSWHAKFKQLPALIKLTIHQGKEEILTVVDMDTGVCYPMEKVRT